MEEVVKKAKLHKHLRQTQRAEDTAAIDELDKGMDAVMGLLLRGANEAEKVGDLEPLCRDYA